MTKQELQKELQDKVKPGVKPSDIKRLKRSKSDSDIANIPPPPPLPPNHLLSDQLKEKQQEIEVLRKKTGNSAKQIEELRAKLETTNQELKETRKQLDNSLAARTNSSSEWTKQREQIQALSKELDETIDQASTELTAGDTEISQLRTKVWTLKSAKEQLERDLKRERVKRNSPTLKNPTPNNFLPPLDHLQFTFYTLLAVGFTLWLTNTRK